MKKVIDAINDGQINRKFGALTFSVSAVELNVKAGTVCEGSFGVLATTHNLAEGYAYSDDYRMELITTEFSGVQDEIAYRFHAENMSPGQDIKGNFIIISNRGEYTVPFVIHIEADVFESSIGPVRNIFHFTNLAKANWSEALRLFYSPGFERIFTGSDREFLPVYKCLSGVSGSAYNMDEFLVAIRKKTPVEYIPSEKSIEINDPIGVSRYTFNISRNGWGYTKLHLWVEGDFITLDHSDVDYEAFLGNNLQVNYYIDADKMHAGKNLGAIVLSDDRYETRINVVANSNRDGLKFKNMTMMRMKNIVKMMELYQSFRLKKVSARMWFTESNAVVEQMLARDPEDLMFRLYQAHVMITQERNNEGEWHLRKIRAQAESLKNEKPELWCYYLYLSSMIDDSSLNLSAYVEEVEYYYDRQPDNWRIAWLLSFMSDEYRTTTRKWFMYEEAFKKGCKSPVILLEAARLALDNPSIITKLEGFDLQVLRYICKREMMNDELVFTIRALAEHNKEYSEALLKLLFFCYQDNPHDELLTLICSQLIKGDRTDAEAFKWYGYAVKQGLRITRLYEFYMQSIDKTKMQQLPRAVLLYFSFHSDLDYETNAYLYASVVNDRLVDADMYSKYQKQIEDFVYEQLEEGHNNRYLAILYRNLIDDSMLIDERFASKVANIIFMHEIDATEYPEVRNVILCYDHRDGEEVYPIANGMAVLPIYSSNYCLAFEDAEYHRTVVTRKITPVQLMPPGRLLLNIQLILKKHVAIDAHFCMEHQLAADIRPENEFRFRNLLDIDYFSKEHAKAITMRLVNFYYEHDRMDELDSFLQELDSNSVSEFERAECVRYLIKRGMYDKAIKWIYMYGPEGIDSDTMGKLIYGWLPVHREDTDKYGNLIQQLLMEVLDTDKLTTVDMQYLVKNAYGTVRTLRDIWIKAADTEVERRDLEERIIVQLIFSGAYIPEKGDIIKEYAYHLPDGDILRAALNVSCYEYFVDNVLISDKLFGVCTDAFESELELDKVCILAYVKFYAENRGIIDDKVRPVLKDALHKLMADGVVLACFKELSDFMPSMTSYADSIVIEYRTESAEHVTIHYVIESDAEDDYHSDSMMEVYKGVYTSVFTLFFGEKLMYYITEETEEETESLLESNSIMRSDIGDSVSRGRFGLINDICIAKTLRDYTTVDNLLDEYYRKSFMTDKLFGMYKG